MIIYNLFPLLAGRFSDWKPHLERAASLGFDTVFINPIQYPGFSGSLYSIKDYFRLHHLLIDESSEETPEEQFLNGVAKPAKELGLDLIVDLVISHCAFDSDLIKDHPQWFVMEDGKVAHPSCMEGQEKVVWRDLAKFDHQHSSQQDELFRFCLKVVNHLMKLGFIGFRCDAAYQIPAAFWKRLIEETRQQHPGAMFLAETLGCVPEETLATASAGFDYLFNSAKWWDFHGSWLMEQYHLTRESTQSISFPESHDTLRLAEELNGQLNAIKQRLFFTSVFSSGVMMPMGLEYGFKKPLHVVDTRPEDWEEPNYDLTGYIKKLNAVKAANPILQEEAPTKILESSNPNVLLMWKGSDQAQQEVLLIINKDPYHPQDFYSENLYHHIQASPPLLDLSPEHAMEFLPTPFHYQLRPGQGILLATRTPTTTISRAKVVVEEAAKPLPTPPPAVSKQQEMTAKNSPAIQKPGVAENEIKPTKISSKA